jgi:hypothetical protein
VISLTFWEAEELLEHCVKRDDIWMQSEENPYLWLRTDGSGDSLCAILIVPPPDETSPYRRYGLDIIPMTYSQGESEEYVRKLLRHWTLYGHRMDVQALLIDELKVPEAVAEVVAIAIESFDWIDKREDPDRPDSVVKYQHIDAQAHVGTWLLAGGGYVKLRFLGGMIRTSLSIPNPNSGGYDHPLEGYVRPRDGRIEEACASLAGWPTRMLVPVNSDIAQLKLPGDMNVQPPVVAETPDAP